MNQTADKKLEAAIKTLSKEDVFFVLQMAKELAEVKKLRDEVATKTDPTIISKKLDELKQYTTSSPPVYGSGNSLVNPAMLFDVFLEMDESGSSKSIYDRYRFSNGQWQWVSKYVTKAIIEANIGRIEPLL
jgi:hypothetical protein